MSFSTPLALWLLLPLAVLLFERFRRRDRRRVRVATIAIWRALADREAGRVRRPRPPLELLVEAALGVALVLLAAGPVREETEPPELVVLVDAGSAMATPVRSEALRRAVETIEREAGRAAILRRQPEVAGSGPAVTDEFLWSPRLAALSAPDRELWLVADAVADLDRLPEGVGLVVIDGAIANVGITAAAVEVEGDSLRIFVALATSAGAARDGISLALRDPGGVLLASRAVAFEPGADEASLEFLLAAPRADRLNLELEGETGPAFDDRVLIERVGPTPRFLLAPFEGASSWAAALEAAGQKAVRGAQPGSAAGEFIPILIDAPTTSGPALVLAARGRSGPIEREVDPEIAGRPFEPETGEVLADLPAADRLLGSSGACFAAGDESLRVLARRGGRPVVIFDPLAGRIWLADPESAAAWSDAAAFPVLVERLASLLAETAGGGGGWRSGPLSTPGETAGRAAPVGAFRKARPAVEQRRRRDLRLESALLALVLLGILAFLRLRAPARRESPGCD